MCGKEGVVGCAAGAGSGGFVGAGIPFLLAKMTGKTNCWPTAY